MIKEFAELFSKTYKIKILFDDSLRIIKLGNEEIEIHCNLNARKDNKSTTYFDVIKRTYTKKHNVLEKKFIKFVSLKEICQICVTNSIFFFNF